MPCGSAHSGLRPRIPVSHARVAIPRCQSMCQRPFQRIVDSVPSVRLRLKGVCRFLVVGSPRKRTNPRRSPLAATDRSRRRANVRLLAENDQLSIACLGNQIDHWHRSGSIASENGIELVRMFLGGRLGPQRCAQAGQLVAIGRQGRPDTNLRRHAQTEI